jgi:SAM-dependent methyltransferase
MTHTPSAPVLTPAEDAVFGPIYAGAYDALYATKDYARECDAIERIFATHGDGAIASVLDLGCGTGNHALPLVARGYRITAVDRSLDMLAVARAKDATGAVRWLEGDVRTVDAGAPYDAALMMFAVLGYQKANGDIRATFANVRRHLRPGSLFVFDAWYGPGVIADPPGAGSRIVETPAGAIRRDVTSALDVRRHLCAVTYTLARPADAAVTRETHTVRFFFPMEIEMYLEAAGFETVAISALDDLDRDPTERDWNALVVARAA